MLAGTLPGHVYSREGHPNAQTSRPEKAQFRSIRADGAVVASAACAALATVLLAECRQGDMVPS